MSFGVSCLFMSFFDTTEKGNYISSGQSEHINLNECNKFQHVNRTCTNPRLTL